MTSAACETTCLKPAASEIRVPFRPNQQPLALAMLTHKASSHHCSFRSHFSVLFWLSNLNEKRTFSFLHRVSVGIPFFVDRYLMTLLLHSFNPPCFQCLQTINLVRAHKQIVTFFTRSLLTMRCYSVTTEFILCVWHSKPTMPEHFLVSPTSNCNSLNSTSILYPKTNIFCRFYTPCEPP